MRAVAKKRRPATDRQIIAAYRRTGTINGVRRACGCGWCRIRAVLVEAGIYARRIVPVPTPEEIAERAAEIRRGWTGGAYDPADDPD
jgi:hypothetical protein